MRAGRIGRRRTGGARARIDWGIAGRSRRNQEATPIFPVSDRADAIISHEYEELLADGDHAKAIKNAAKTKLPIGDGARRLNRARAR
jgi:hypothetical protein